MKKFLFLFFLIITMPSIFCNQAKFLNSLSEKENASFSDCVKCFCYLHNIDVSENFMDNIKSLQKFIPKMPRKYIEDKKLTIGDFSLLTIQYLKIKSGLFYLATKSGRYATRELIEIKIIPFNTSEWKKISGIELIRLLQKVDEYAESKKTK
ncbi:MAG: hypothetical protein KAT05_01105 [Spirochaetes bacterium]|nr:hypothetical protein [Spirochaetota bacterium]